MINTPVVDLVTMIKLRESNLYELSCSDCGQLSINLNAQAMVQLPQQPIWIR